MRKKKAFGAPMALTASVLFQIMSWGYSAELRAQEQPAGQAPPGSALVLSRQSLPIRGEEAYFRSSPGLNFGGSTSALAHVAQNCLRVNNLHIDTTCSPTRGALLAGGTRQAPCFGHIMEFATGFSGYDSVAPKSPSTISNILTGRWAGFRLLLRFPGRRHARSN